MHRIRLIGRPVALVALTAVLLAVVAWFSGGVPQQDRAHADFMWWDQYYVSCADTYLDAPPLKDPKENVGPGPEDPRTSMALTRGEPSQTVPGAIDLTTVTYLGPDLNPYDGIDVPGKPPTNATCGDTGFYGQFEPEHNRLNSRLWYQIVSNTRPTVTAQIEPKLVGGLPTDVMKYTTCDFSEALGTWVRYDVEVYLQEKDAKSVNFGQGKLYTDAGHPDCDVSGSTPYVDYWPFHIVSYTRDATTDHPELPKNDWGILAGDLILDPDGPHPKEKGEKQGPDGVSGELVGGPYISAGLPVPFLADDWDGDGCPDWDELDKNFMNGVDPFNPHDCNISVNPSGIYYIEAATVAASKAPDGTLVPGVYYHCIGDQQQDGNDLEMRLLCYIDILGVPVNPKGGPESGDGLRGVPPPPPYADVDDVHSVLTGALDPGTNRITMSGCIEDRDGQGALGNVYVESDQDAHSGKGTVDIYVLESQANCTGGTPAGTPAVAELHTVKWGEKGPAAMWEPHTAAGGFVDSDGDNCPDKNELSDNQQQGGLRDPFNRWDYFNPTLDKQNRVDDILRVVNQYFIDKGNPDYTKNTDRTAVIGANPWNLGPPNGQQRVDDILAAVKSYFHDCEGGKWVNPDEPEKPDPWPPDLILG